MDIGFCLPYMKDGLDRATLLEWCRRIDQGPFSTISCGERITGPAATYDMRVLLAMAAAVTERVQIAATLYVLPMHSAVRAAQEIATLDVISGGRVRLTVGFGGREKDYAAVGAPFKGRYQRMDEQIATLKRVWAGAPPVEGADPVGPRPLQPGGPPIFGGVMGPKAMARVSKWADGVYAFSMNGQGADIQYTFAMADDAWAKSQRDSKPRRIGGFWYCLSERDADRKLKDYGGAYLRSSAGKEIATAISKTLDRSSPDAVLESIDALEAQGCEELLLVPATAELAEIDRIVELLEKRG